LSSGTPSELYGDSSLLVSSQKLGPGIARGFFRSGWPFRLTMPYSRHQVSGLRTSAETLSSNGPTETDAGPEQRERGISDARHGTMGRRYRAENNLAPLLPRRESPLEIGP